MKRKILKVDEERKIVQITTVDERWYTKPDDKGNDVYVPSVTWIAEHYPKGVGFYKWLATKGWQESEALKIAAGDKGSKVHFAIKDLIKGKTISINSKFLNPSTGKDEELTLEEYECLMSFVGWWGEAKPVPIDTEFVVWSDKHNYAGTVDFVCLIKDKPYIIDFKTSQSIWPSHLIQISAYKEAMPFYLEEDYKLAILQLGYWRTKKKFKFTEVDDKFDLFLSAKAIWAEETAGQKPFQKDYPETLTIEGR